MEKHKPEHEDADRDDDAQELDEETSGETENTDDDVEKENEPAESSAHHDGKQPGRLKRVWGWVRASRKRTVLAAAAVVLVLGGAAVGATDLRYPVLGLVLTTEVKVTVTDSTTKQPVPKADVSFGGATGTTDTTGAATLMKVKLGRSTLAVHKTGYSDYQQAQLAPLRHGSVAKVVLRPNGIKVVTTVSNRITGGSVAGVEVKSGDASAITDNDGRAEVSLPIATNGTKQTLSLSKDGFNDATQDVTVKSGADPVAVKMTPAGKVYFQSNRTGRIDIYSSNLDGTAAQVVLAGTGNEDSATGILPSIKDPHVLAIVSSRDGRRTGSLHHDLYIFNTESGKLNRIDTDIDFGSFRAWLGSTLVYAKPEPSVGYYGSCNSLKSYDTSNGKTATVVMGNLDNGGCPFIQAVLRDGFIYSVNHAPDPTKNGTYAARLTGTPKRISSTPVDNTIQRAKQTLLTEYYDYSQVSGSSQLWQSIDLGNLSVTKIPDGPSIETSRYYNDSSDGDKSAFVEERDGKSELYVTDGDGGNEQKLTSIGSVNQFVQWYGGSDYIVFSSTKTGENALYIVATSGGTPVKISDFYRGNERTYGGGGNPYQ